ncbi:hypothetical protein HanIR_Chr02g0069221 [Helianthus annuus]|nr:hypothetical protein HanIR_Chr02g0069221 [Helianthus annuus]
MPFISSVKNIYIGGGSILGVDRHVLGWHALACAGMACQGQACAGKAENHLPFLLSNISALVLLTSTSPCCLPDM